MKKRKKIIILLAFVISTIFIFLFSVRNNAIRNHDWKLTGGAEMTNDFICLTEASSYSYDIPIIRKDDKIIAIAIFRFKKNLMVFSTEKKSVSFLMAI